jgi:hypothetical protein
MNHGINLAHFFLSLQTQIRIYHWQTKSYSRHKATDGLLEKLEDNIDKFMEVYQGRYKKLKLGSTKIMIELCQLTDKQAKELLLNSIKFLHSITIQGLVNENDTELLNIRDEIVGDLQQALYLFSFH